MTATSDVIVVGLGAMGSAVCYHAARRGLSVRGFDRHAPPHAFGSTHGLSRIIREAYFEHPLYVPLVQRAFALWAELEQRSGRRLFRRTGGLMVGPEGGTLVTGALASALEHALEHEVLDAADVRRRFPVFAVPDDMVAVLEPRAGVLDPASCVRAHLELARDAGAATHAHEPVQGWRADGGTVVVTTTRGAYRASHLVLAAGAWNPPLLGPLPVRLGVERQVMLWFTPAADAEAFAPAHCPIAMIEYGPGRYLYTLPDSGDGIKAAIHHEGEATDPDDVRRTVDEADVEPVRALLRRFLPTAGGALRNAATCLYTNTDDHDFVIDVHPVHAEVVIVSACSGHGFKFASAIGEAVTALVTGERPRTDLSPFRIGRFLSRRS